jgi:hypothetical protein
MPTIYITVIIICITTRLHLRHTKPSNIHPKFPKNNTHKFKGNILKLVSATPPSNTAVHSHSNAVRINFFNASISIFIFFVLETY